MSSSVEGARGDAAQGAALRRLRALTAGVALLCLLGMLALTLFEVVMRAVGRPTDWALDATAYFLCFGVAAAFPAVTANRAHVSVDLIRDALPGRGRAVIERAVAAVCAAACLAAAALVALVLADQYADGVTTLTGVIIPKWILSAALLYGFGASGLVFAAVAAFGAPPARREASP